VGKSTWYRPLLKDHPESLKLDMLFCTSNKYVNVVVENYLNKIIQYMLIFKKTSVGKGEI